MNTFASYQCGLIVAILNKVASDKDKLAEILGLTSNLVPSNQCYQIVMILSEDNSDQDKFTSLLGLVATHPKSSQIVVRPRERLHLFKELMINFKRTQKQLPAGTTVSAWLSQQLETELWRRAEVVRTTPTETKHPRALVQDDNG